MKEELKTLKNSTIKILKKKEETKNSRNEFNNMVEQKKNEYDIEELFNNDDFFVEGDSFDAAILLNTVFPQIHKIVLNNRKEYPNYEKKSLKMLTVMKLTFDESIQKEYQDKINILVDNYFLYEECGFFDLKNKLEEIEKLEKDIKDSSITILGETKEATVKAIESVKPYGKIVKEQSKTAINKGSKTLIKVLEKVEKRTNN